LEQIKKEKCTLSVFLNQAIRVLWISQRSSGGYITSGYGAVSVGSRIPAFQGKHFVHIKVSKRPRRLWI